MTSQILSFTSNTDEQNYFNPIRQHLKKTTSTKNQNRPRVETGPILNSHKQLRFKDLSKDKVEFYTQLPKRNEDSFGDILGKDSSMSSIRRRLFDNGGMSRQKSMSFTDVIKQSREKRLRQESSSSKLSLKKQMKSGKKEGKVFNALKARLLGENNPNAANIIKPPISTKDSLISRPPRPIPRAHPESTDMVRISTQFQSPFLNKSLQMTPL